MDSLEPVGRMSKPYKPVPPPPPLLGAEGHASLEQLRLMLGKRIYHYNTVNPSDVFGIKLKENLQFEGSLTFLFNKGGDEIMKVVTMTSATTVTDLLPQLIERFCFNHLDSPNDIMFNPSDNYLTMQTEAGERRLKNEEHPLQLALDVVEQTKANPTFRFHTKILERCASEEPDIKRSSKFVSYEEVGSQVEKSTALHSELQPAASLTSVNSSSSGSGGTPKNLKSRMHTFLRRSPVMSRRGRSSNNSPATAMLPTSTTNTYPPPNTSAASASQQMTDQKRTKRGRSSVGYLLDSLNINKSRSSIGTKDDLFTPARSGSVISTPPELGSVQSLLSRKSSSKKRPKSTLLPIYGPTTTVASGQVYKTVLVSKESSTKEVIRQALERYAVQASHDEYVLMDTIGQDLPTPSLSEDVNDVVFTRVCSRQLHKEEIPVIIDQLWKPAEGYLRRFELVKRSEVCNMLAQGHEADSESTTASVCLYPERPASCMSHTEQSSGKLSDSSSTDVELQTSKSEDEVLSQSWSSTQRPLKATVPYSFAAPRFSSPTWGRQLDALCTRSQESSPVSHRSGRRASLQSGLYQVPQGSPYLLNMTPSRMHSDHVLFQLGPSTTQLGIFHQDPHPCSPLATEDTATVHLHALAEAFPEPVDQLVVCQIRCFPFYPIGRKKLYPTVLEVHRNEGDQRSTSVSLNGCPLVPGESCIMEHADVLQIGEGCMLMYIDPTVTVDNLTKRSPRWVATALKEPRKVEKKRHGRPVATPSTGLPRDDSGTLSFNGSHENVNWVSVEELEAKQGIKKGEGHNTSPSLSNHLRKQSSDFTLSDEHSHSEQDALVTYRSGRWMLDLTSVDVEAMLQNIAQKAIPPSLSNKLAIAYTLALGVEWCRQQRGGDSDALSAVFLGQAVGVLQSSVMDTCRVISEWKPDPAQLLSTLDNTLHPAIGRAVFWLSNVLALSGYLQGLPPTDPTLPEDLQTALRQLAQYAMQELLYPIRKVMYGILPRLVEESAAWDSPETTTKGYMDQAVNFLQLVLYAFEDHRVSSAITAQFFGMVFCFINGALLNLLFSSDTNMNALTHTCGIRLKNYLDILKGWSNGVQLSEELQKYLAPLMSAVGLLCTPGKQLMRMKWPSLRATHPLLHPAQLHFILDHYDLPEGCPKPKGWAPPTEALEEAMHMEMLEERLDRHPPIDLAGNQPQMDLSVEPPDVEELVKLVAMATSMLASRTDYHGKRDSPYSDSGVDSPARSAEKSPSGQVPLVFSASVNRSLETVSVENPPVTEETVVMETINMDEEQPPPLRVITGSAPGETETGEAINQVTPTHFRPHYTEVVLSRGSKDFGLELSLSESPKGSRPRLTISSIVLGSLSDETDGLLQLSVGDNIVKMDGIDMCDNLQRAQDYLRNVEDEVALTIIKNSQTA